MGSAPHTAFRIISLLAATVLVASATEQEIPLRAVPNYLPPEVERILAEGEFELLSIDPDLLTDKQRRRLRTKLFHGYRVLGKVKIQKGPERDQLLQALQQAITNSPFYTTNCFDPRHAIRASVGPQRVDLLICFACARIEVYSPDNSPVATNASAQPALDAVLKRAGIPLASN